MSDFIGLVPVPDDANMEEFINSVMERDRKFLAFILNELEESKEQTKTDELPDNFTYGKLLQFINHGMTHDDRIHLGAMALETLSQAWTILQERCTPEEKLKIFGEPDGT